MDSYFFGLMVDSQLFRGVTFYIRNIFTFCKFFSTAGCLSILEFFFLSALVLGFWFWHGDTISIEHVLVFR